MPALDKARAQGLKVVTPILRGAIKREAAEIEARYPELPAGAETTFRVMGNEVLLDLSRNPPRSVSELAAIKGMPKGMIDRAGADIIAAVRRGVEVPEAELPRFPKSQRWNKDKDFEARVIRLLGSAPRKVLGRSRVEAARRQRRHPTRRSHAQADRR